MERAIVHIDIPDFYSVVEETRDPVLKRRVLVFAAQGPRAVIQAVNANARKEGIIEGMPLAMAQRLCRKLLIIPPDIRLYKERHESILNGLLAYSPLVEGIHLGHFFLDLTGTRRLWGPANDTVFSIEKALHRKEGLPVRGGVAANKLVSQVAAHLCRAGDLSCIFSGLERPFLAPLPVTALPGVGEKTAKRLLDLNIERVGELSEIPSREFCSVFGKAGSRLLEIARGIDHTPVLPFRQAQRLSFQHEFDRDEINRERIEAALLKVCEEAGWQLRSLNRSPGRLSLEIRYADGITAQASETIHTASACIDPWLFRATLKVYDRLPYRRVSIRRITLEFFEFRMPLRQMSLFGWEEEPTEKDRELQGALDGVREKYGRGAIFWGRSAL